MLLTLLRRLAFKLPTVLQIHPSYVLLFHEGGVKDFVQFGTHTYNNLTSKADPFGRIWALVDSSDGFVDPSPMFKGGSFFVVLSAPSHPASNDWARKIGFKFFYMKLWSFSEVIQA